MEMKRLCLTVRVLGSVGTIATMQRTRAWCVNWLKGAETVYWVPEKSVMTAILSMQMDAHRDVYSRPMGAETTPSKRMTNRPTVPKSMQASFPIFKSAQMIAISGIAVCSGGTVRVELNFVHRNGDIDARLLNDVGISLESAVSSTDNETLSWRNPGAEIATIDLEVYGFSGAENQYDMRITLENCGEAPFNGMDDGELRLPDGPDENSGRL